MLNLQLALTGMALAIVVQEWRFARFKTKIINHLNDLTKPQ